MALFDGAQIPLAKAIVLKSVTDDRVFCCQKFQQNFNRIQPEAAITRTLLLPAGVI